MGFADSDFRDSPYMRLKMLERHLAAGRLAPTCGGRPARKTGRREVSPNAARRRADVIELEKRGDDRGFFARISASGNSRRRGWRRALFNSTIRCQRAEGHAARAALSVAARRRRSRSCAACAARCGTRSSICGRTRQVSEAGSARADGRQPADDVCAARLRARDPHVE